MLAYDFQPRFRQPILDDLKTSTIRRERNRGHAKIGDTLQLYTGMRTRACEMICEAECISSLTITLFIGPESEPGFTLNHVLYTLNGDIDALVRSEGFASWIELQAFFVLKYGPHDFTGRRIAWRRKS